MIFIHITKLHVLFLKQIKFLFLSPFGVMERSREIGRRPLLGVMGGRGVFDLCISINMFHRSSSWPLALTFSKQSMRYWTWSVGRWNMRPVIRHCGVKKENKHSWGDTTIIILCIILLFCSTVAFEHTLGCEKVLCHCYAHKISKQVEHCRNFHYYYYYYNWQVYKCFIFLKQIILCLSSYIANYILQKDPNYSWNYMHSKMNTVWTQMSDILLWNKKPN